MSKIMLLYEIYARKNLKNTCQNVVFKHILYLERDDLSCLPKSREDLEEEICQTLGSSFYYPLGYVTEGSNFDIKEEGKEFRDKEIKRFLNTNRLVKYLLSVIESSSRKE